MRTEMKFILSAFVVASMLVFDAAAQPAPPPLPPSAGGQPAVATNHPAAPPANRPMATPLPGNHPPMNNMPPGLMPGAPKTPPVMPDKDKLSYAIGFNIASTVKRDELDVDVDTIANAMKDVLTGKTPKYGDKEVREILMQFQGAMRAKAQADREKQMSEAKAKADEYLTKNAKDPAVKSLPNGLQYKVLKDGSGPMPKPTDSVTVAYKGRLVDGTLFDQNENFKTPVTGRTIKGWSEVLPMMKTGSKWEVTIPPDLGYGARPSGKIPPNSVLIFEMELISISPPSQASAAPAPAPATAHPVNSPAITSTVSGQIIKVPSKEELDKGAKIEVITNAPGQ
jgi:FKBP-type peptidyl-prolyl cis-trans isomerase